MYLNLKQIVKDQTVILCTCQKQPHNGNCPYAAKCDLCGVRLDGKKVVHKDTCKTKIREVK